MEVDGPQIYTGRPSTTRVATSDGAMRSKDDPCTSSHDGDGNPGTSSGDEHGYGIKHSTRSVVERTTAMQGSGTRGHDGGCLARNDGNPGTSSHNEDYSSYLTLLAALPVDYSDDEELNQAIIASMESPT